MTTSEVYGIERYAGMYFPNGAPCYGVTSSAQGGDWTRDAAGYVFLYPLETAREVARALNASVRSEVDLVDECPQCGAMIPVSQFATHPCV